MVLERLADNLQLRAVLRWFRYQPKLGVISKWLDCQKGLAVHDELAKIIWRRDCEASLLPNDSSTGDASYDARDAMPPKQNIAHAESGEVPIVISKFAGLHDG
ncbi:hypothetical protein [Undibacterium macrobrachii]|uniref:hypothetical protein n=1 Tax=Undibacterium macrobrachii TaxID=1119058 RepID=UPI001674BDB8|nr:hypothetical protein [Undibacterium macrobrachii]